MYGVVWHDPDVVLDVLPQSQVPGGARGEGRHPLANRLVGLGPDVLRQLGQLLLAGGWPVSHPDGVVVN